MNSDAPSTFRLFSNGPIVQGEPLQLVARAEGDGVIGDAHITLPPDAVWNGVPYAAFVAILKAQGQIDLPEAGDAGEDLRQVVIHKAYTLAFARSAPQPMCIHPAYLTQVVADALEAGKPIPDDFDWYAHLPPDAVA